MSFKVLSSLFPRCQRFNSLTKRPNGFKFSSGMNRDNEKNEPIYKSKEFINQGNIDFERIHINEESISRKQAERSQREDLNIENYRVKKPNQFYDPKTNPNPTRDVFNFHEGTLLQKDK